MTKCDHPQHMDCLREVKVTVIQRYKEDVCLIDLIKYSRCRLKQTDDERSSESSRSYILDSNYYEFSPLTYKYMQQCCVITLNLSKERLDRTIDRSNSGFMLIKTVRVLIIKNNCL